MTGGPDGGPPAKADTAPDRPAPQPGPQPAPLPETAASVIVVSRGRPAELRHCLAALLQLDHAPLELVVVACAAGRAALPPDIAAQVKLVPFETPNLSAGRNLGLCHAAGTVVAFIDDDAVAEPTWLGRLIAPLADPRVGAAGGFVLGRNGMSLQWGARFADDTGQSHDLPADPRAVSLHAPAPGRWPRVEGTNCAFRRADLAALGGFDAAFHYYLDETDLCLRLGKAGWLTALVPDALVHHGHAGGPQRRSDRAPRSLADIGASSAVFLRKHAPAQLETATQGLRADQRRRLLSLMVSGALSPGDIAPLLATLAQGIDAGRSRPLAPPAPIGPPLSGFRPLPRGVPLPRRVLAGRLWHAARLRRQAAAEAVGGCVTTLFLLSPTLRRHRARFCLPGYWEHRGGVAGRAERRGGPRLFLSLRQRVRRELARISGVRGPFDADSAL